MSYVGNGTIVYVGVCSGAVRLISIQIKSIVRGTLVLPTGYPTRVCPMKLSINDRHTAAILKNVREGFASRRITRAATCHWIFDEIILLFLRKSRKEV